MTRAFHILVICFVVFLTACASEETGSKLADASKPSSSESRDTIIVDAEIDTVSKHSYGLDLDEDRFVIMRAVRGSFEIGEEVNLAITVRDPDGTIIEQTNTAGGTSLLVLLNEKAGKHSVEIEHWNGADTGTYSLYVDVNEPAAETRTGRLHQLFKHIYSDTRPGAAIAIINQGDVDFAESYGLANLAKRTPLTPETPLELASASKQFTAFGIALLQSRDALNVQDTLSSHIADMAPAGDTITLHHLVHHLSGIQDYEESLSPSEMSRDNILQALYDQPTAYFEPGTNYRYSNGGYVLLAKVIEEVTGSDFSDWMGANLFTPLGMDNSFVLDPTQPADPSVALSYKKVADGYDNLEHPIDGYEHVPSDLEAIGGAHVHASLNDMIKWSLNYRSKTVGGASVADLIDDGIIPEEQPWDYLFGLKQFTDRGLLRRGHEGLTHGFRSVYAWFPGADVFVIYLTNDGEWRSYYLAEKVIDIYMGDRMSPRSFDQ